MSQQGVRNRGADLIVKVTDGLDSRLPLALTEPGEEPRRRARMLLALRDVMLVATIFGVIVRIADGFLPLVIVPVVLLAVVLAIPTILRRTGSVSIAAHTFVASFVLVLGVTNIIMGGILFGLQTATAVLPLIAVLLLGSRAAIPWTLLCLLQLTVGVALRKLGIVPFEVGQTAVTSSAAPLIILVVVHGVAAWQERLKTNALTRLGRARDEADRANAAKSEFLSHMSHELRTPMNGVLGALEIVCDTPLDADQLKYIEICRDSARHMLTLLNEILDETKLTSGAVVLEQTPIELESILCAICDGVRSMAQAKGLSLVTTCDLSAGDTIVGDPLRLRQVVINLLNNALKFTAEGEITVLAKSRAAGEGRLAIEIAVTDTGIGIRPEALPILFEAFTQAEVSTTRRYGGTGLGLRITKQIVDLMGGEVAVESEVGKGSTFTLRFEAPVGQIEVIKPPKRSRQLGDLGLNVLVAEDNDVNQMIVQRMLLALGCESTCVSNGREAVDKVRSHDYDCVLMDCQMPVMDGYEAARCLRDFGEDLPVIALTAHVLPSERDKCLAAGMNDMMSKPVSLDVLAETLSRWSVTRDSELSSF